MKILSLFSGIGAFEKALTNIGIDYELVGFSEIDKYAVKSYCAIHGVDKNLNLGDISKIDVESLPTDIDMITHGSPCFTGDTLVLTNKGYKEIKDVKIGDYVLDHTNKYNKVINFLNQGFKEIWEIKGMSLDILETTENHKFLVRKRERIWDNKNRKYIRNFSSPQWVECTRGKSKYIKNNLKKYFENPKFWYLCGRFLGDGWIRKRKQRNNNLSSVLICCGKHEDKDFENKIGDLFHYTKVEDRTVYKYQFSNKELAVFLSQFGQGAKNKFVPSFVIDLPKELLKHFLDGYFDADGYVSKTNELKAASISRELIYGIAQCGIKVYHKPCSIYKTVRSNTHIIENRLVNQNDTYHITFYNQNHEPFYEDGYIWFPIRSVKNTHTKKITYDITVENTHSFTANACIVHNCQDYSIAGKGEGGDKDSGTRSSLMWYAVEIVKHCKPKYVIWENVKNVLSKKHKHNFEQYLKDLEDLGYTSYYKVLNAKDFGIPQNRERIYCISILGEHKPYEFPNEFELKWRLKDLLQDSVESKYYLSEKIQNRFKQIKEIKEENNVIGTTKPEFRTIGQRDLVYNKDGIMGTLNATDYKQPKQILEVDEKYYINKSWHFTRSDERKHDANEIAQVDDIKYKTTRSVTDPNKICRCLDTMGGGQREPKIITEKIAQKVKVRKYPIDIEKLKKVLREGKKESNLTIHDISDLLRVNITTVEHWFRSDNCFSIPSEDIWEDLKTLLKIKTDEFDKAITEFEYKDNEYDMSNRVYNIEGISPTLTSSGESSAKKIKMPNSKIVCEQRCDEGLRFFKDNVCGTIRTINAGGDKRVIETEPNFRIRKLTPLECWRLMGFDDEDFYKAKNVPMSDTQLYRQAGNSIVVNVLEEIFKKLFFS